MADEILTDADVGLAPELSDSDVGLDVSPQINLSPYEELRMKGVGAGLGATTGPASPEEVLKLGQLVQIPGEALGQITGTASDLASDFLRRTGIDPSAQPGRPIVQTGPLPITNIPGTGISPMRLVAPEFTKGVERKAGEIVSGFTEPGQAALLPLAAESKAIQALFAGQAAAQIPDSVKSIARAKNPQELGAALTEAGTDVAMAYALGRGLLRGPVTEPPPKGVLPEEPVVAEPTQPPGPPPAGPAPSITPPPPAGEGAPVPPESPAITRARQEGIEQGVKLLQEQVGLEEAEARRLVTSKNLGGEIQDIESELKLKFTPEELDIIKAGHMPDFEGAEGAIIGSLKPSALTQEPKLTPEQLARLQGRVRRAREEGVLTPPEVASMGPATAGGKDPFGNPLGTKYRASAEDWARWQELQARIEKAKAAKDFNAMPAFGKEVEAIKKKYAGSIPMPPKEPVAPKATAATLTPDDLQPALLVNGKPVTGGTDHEQIFRNATAAEEDPERVSDIFNAHADDSKHVFVDKVGNVYTRDQAAKALGEKDPLQSSRLRELKQKGKPAVATRGRATTADILGKVSQRLDTQAEAARARLAAQRQRGVGGKFNLGPLGELENIRDFAIIGAAKIAKGATEFARWSGEMVKDFGEGIKPHLENIFARAQQAFDDHASVVTRVNRVLYEAGLPRKAISEAGKKAVGKAIEAGTEAGRALAEAEAAPALADIQQQLSDSIPKAQALGEYFRGQEMGGAAGRKAATDELKLADKWLEGDAQRIRDSLIAFANASLPVAERGRFLKAITDATRRPPLLKGDPEVMYRRAATVAARIEDRAADVRKAGVASEIKDAVTKAIQSPGVDIGYKKRILDAVKRVTFTKPLESTTDALKATRDYLASQEAAGKDVAMPKEVLDELEVLNKIPVRELPEHVLEAMRDKVNLLDQLGRLKVKARKQAWEIEKNNKLKQLADEATNPIQERPEFRQQPGDPRPLSIRIRNWANRQLNIGTLLDKALLPIDALFDLLGDAKGTYRGWLFKNVRNPLDLDFNSAQVMRDTKTAPLEAIIKANNLGERESERIGVYAAVLQEGGLERLVEMGVKPETIDGILKSITPAEMEAYRVMRAAMDSTLPDVQKLMHELYNIEVKPVSDYFPMPRDWNLFEPEPKPLGEPRYGKEMDFDELSGWKQMLGDFTVPKTTKSERGFTLERQKGAATPIKLNAFDVFFQHMNDVAYLLKTQRDLKMIGEMSRGDLFKQKYGNVGQNIVTSWLDTVARQGRIGGFRRIPMLDELRRRTSAGVIGFRLASQFVHLSNIPLAVWRTGGPLWWKAGLGESLSERGQNFLRDNFSETFARGGGEPALVEASQSDLSVFGKRLVPKAVIRAGFAIARQIDRYNAQATTLGIYLRLLSEKGLDARNYDKIPVDKDAQAQALVLSRRAVASPLPKDVSASLARGAITGGNISLGRTIFQFQNIFQDQWSNIRHDLARAGIREKNPKLAATAFVALAAMLLSEMGIREGSKEVISGLTGYKAKKESSPQERIALEAARRIPFGGQISSQLLYGETGVPVIDSIVDTEKAIKQAATAKKEATQQKALVRAVAGAAQLGGVPGASQVGELIQKAQ